MNYLDAIRSHRPYRRKCWDNDSWRKAVSYATPHFASFTETYGDLICEDWEVQEEPITLTKEKFFEVFSDGMKHAFTKTTFHLSGNSDTKLATDILEYMVSVLFKDQS